MAKIHILGGSGSGKTTLAHNLSSLNTSSWANGLTPGPRDDMGDGMEGRKG